MKFNITATLILSTVVMLLPASVEGQSSYNIYFGDIHSHTWYSDGSQDKDTNTYKKPVAQAITYARSSPSMNFLGVSDHNHNEGGLHMTLGYWRAGNQEADSVNQDGVFPGLYGQEWGTISAGGHALIYGTNKLFGWDPGVYDVYVAKGNYGMLFDSLKKYSGFVYLAHPNQTDFGGIFTNAYNASWDSVVMGVAMRNGPATSTNTTESDPSTTDYSARYHDLLRLGYHVAPCANQDNHNTTFGRVNQQRTAVLASSLTRAGILDALRNRRAYATTDHNLQLRLEVGSHQMGEIFAMGGPVTLRVNAFDPDGEHMNRIELRYGVPGSGSAPTVLTSVTGLDSLTYIQAQPANSTFYYYAYVVENDGQSAWSAPLWITTTTVAPPPVVTLVSPSNGTTNQSVTPLLQWRTSATATSYRVQISSDSTFASGIVLDDNSVVDTTRVASGLGYSTRYFWHVNAKNSGGSSAFSSSSSFTTQPAPIQTIIASSGGNGTISPSGSVSVATGANQSFTMLPNIGYHVDSVLVDNVRVDSLASYTFVNVSAGHTIRAVFTIDQHTISATSGSNGSISPAGQVLVNHGSSKSFVITPNGGYHIDSVLVDGVKVDSTSGYTFTNVVASHTIRTVFAINQYTITATFGSNGSISPAGQIVVSHGTNRSFVVSPNGGYHVDSLLVDGIRVDSTTSFTFINVTAAHSIRAVFAISHYTITASSGLYGSILPSGVVNIIYGGTQVFSMTPVVHCHLDSLIVDGLKVDSVSGYTFTNVIGNHTIRAVFAFDQYTITAVADSHGTITPSGLVSVLYGGTRTFAMSPATGYHVDSLFVDNTLVDSTLSYTFSGVVENHTIRAAFSINRYTINANAGPHGTISPSGTVLTSHGSDVLFTATPDEGYSAHFVIDGVALSLNVLKNRIQQTRGANGRPDAHHGSKGLDSPPIVYTFVNVTSDHSIDALFSVDTMIISATTGQHGSISPIGDVTVPYGGSKTFTITPTQYYYVDSVLVDGVKVDSTSSYTFVNVVSAHSIKALFGTTLYTITATAGQHGSITPSGSIPALLGSNQTFTINADFGYEFDSLVVDGISVVPVSTYQFTNVSSSHIIFATFRSAMTSQGAVVNEGWNILSLPLTVSDERKVAVFPSAASSAYAFDPAAGYIVRDTLKNDVGYWLKFPSSQTVNITGLVRFRDTVEVRAGWNLIGSISSPSAVDSILQVPPGIVVSSYYGYYGSYIAADTLMPARAYWVKVNQNGGLVIR